jgi:hypothetical protein
MIIPLNLVEPSSIVAGYSVFPLNLVEPSSIVAGYSVLLVENPSGICLVCQIRFQWNGIFNDSIGRELQTSCELGDMKHIMHSR